jgi:hypothetical protein
MTHFRFDVHVLEVERVLPDVDTDKGNQVEKRVLKSCVDQSMRAGRPKRRRMRTSSAKLVTAESSSTQASSIQFLEYRA